MQKSRCRKATPPVQEVQQVATEKWTNYTTCHISCFPRLNKKCKAENKENIKLHLYSKLINIINNFVWHKNWIDTCDVKILLYWECTNSTLPSIVLESIMYTLYSVILYILQWMFEIRSLNKVTGHILKP